MRINNLYSSTIKFINCNFKEIILSVASGILFYLAFPVQNLYLLEWIAFIPLFFAVKKTESLKTVYTLALITGITFVCLGYTWIPYLCNKFVGIPAPLNYICWVLYGFYNAQVFSIIFVFFKYLENKSRVPEILLFPVIVVAVWSLFPNLFYFTLSNGQSGFLTALQATEFTGTFGLDFIISLFNIALFSLIERRFGIKNYISYALVITVTTAWFSYGSYSIKKWDNEIKKWETKKVGIIQPNRESSFTQLLLEKGETFDKPFELNLYRKLSQSKPSFVVWPEGQYRGYLNYQKVYDSYNSVVKEVGIPLIFHDLPTIEKNNRKTFRNSAVLVQDGKFSNIYNKRKLVPFGEYVPILQWFEGISEMVGLPGITAGEENVQFDIDGMLVQPLICYEIQFSTFVAEAVGDVKGKILLVQSNDGWYGKGAQSEQHRSSNALRAVENRTPLIHVINNGRSAAVLPNGREVYLSESWKRVADIIEIPYNREKGGSFFSKHPFLFVWIVRILFLFLFAPVIINRFNSLKNRRV